MFLLQEIFVGLVLLIIGLVIYYFRGHAPAPISTIMLIVGIIIAVIGIIVMIAGVLGVVLIAG